MDVAPDGGYYVTDRSGKLQKFDSAGNFLWSVGSKGYGSGQFNLPVAVAVDSAGNVYVRDRRNYRVQKFDANGNHLLEWGGKRTALLPPKGRFIEQNGIDVDPTAGHLAVDSQGTVFASDHHGTIYGFVPQ